MMPALKPDQFSAATISSLQAQLAIWSQFADKSFENATKLAELNVNMFKAALEESSAAGRNLLSVKDPQDLLAMTSAQAQPQIGQALSYGREISEIWASMQADFAGAVKAEVEESRQAMAKLGGNTAGTVPGGAVNMADAMKSAFDSANAAYTQFFKTANASTEALQSSLFANTNKPGQGGAKAR
ncbi:MAG: phasin family protein [Pseudomonadota bacterium]